MKSLDVDLFPLYFQIPKVENSTYSISNKVDLNVES